MIRKPILHILFISLILFALGWYLTSFQTFFASDGGLRFMQIRQLIEQNWRTFAIDYPQQILDPNFEHVPYYIAYSLINGEIYFHISNIYPLLVSFFYSVMGTSGLPIVAIAGGILTAVAIYKLATLTKLPHPQLLLWATIFTTPILFYCLVIWDHTLATACAAWAVYGLSKALVKNRWQPAFWAGIIAGFGLAQRPEMYMFLLALGVGVLIFFWRQWRLLLAFALAGFFSTLLVWGIQYLWVGHPFGMAFAPHFFNYGISENAIIAPRERASFHKYSFLLFYVQPGSVLTLFATIMILIGIILIVFSLRIKKLKKPGWLIAGGVVCITGYLLLMYYAKLSIIPGIISTFPLIALSLTFVEGKNGRYDRVHHFIYIVAMLFLAGMILIWPSYGGRQWGARYLLPAYALLVYLAYYAYITLLTQLQNKMQKILRYIVFGLLIISISIQIMGVRASYRMRQGKIYNRTTIASLEPDLLIMDQSQWFVPSMMSSILDKQFLQTSDEKNQQALFTRLQEENISQFGFITSQDKDLPRLPKGSCYQLDKNSSQPECGLGSSCWVYQMSNQCE